MLGRSSKEVVAERHEEGISLPSTLARKKAPPTKRGQGRVVMCAGGCLGGGPPRASPNRICGIGSMVRSVAHNDVRVPKKNAGVRDQDGAGTSRGDSKHEQRSAQRRRPQAGVARRDNEEPRRGAGGRRGSPATVLHSFVGGRCPPEAAAMPEQLKTRCDVPTCAGGSVRQGRGPTVSEKCA